MQNIVPRTFIMRLELYAVWAFLRLHSMYLTILQHTGKLDKYLENLTKASEKFVKDNGRVKVLKNGTRVLVVESKSSPWSFWALISVFEDNESRLPVIYKASFAAADDCETESIIIPGIFGWVMVTFNPEINFLRIDGDKRIDCSDEGMFIYLKSGIDMNEALSLLELASTEGPQGKSFGLENHDLLSRSWRRFTAWLNAIDEENASYLMNKNGRVVEGVGETGPFSIRVCNADDIKRRYRLFFFSGTSGVDLFYYEGLYEKPILVTPEDSPLDLRKLPDHVAEHQIRHLAVSKCTYSDDEFGRLIDKVRRWNDVVPNEAEVKV